MAAKSILIRGPPQTNKEKILHKTITALGSFDDVFSISTSQSRVVDDSTVLTISNSESITPEDLTGIGIELTKWLQTASESKLITLENISTLQMYHSKETLFRFLHIVTQRLENEGATLICIEDTTDDTEGVEPHLKIFDYIIRTRLHNNSLEYTIKQNAEDKPTLRLN